MKAELQRRGATADDFRALLSEVDRASRSIEDSIRLASYFRLFGHKLQFMRDTAKTLGYKFLMEHDGQQWMVGFAPKRGSHKKRIVIYADKLDDAIDEIIGVIKKAVAE
jgi:hypothetical protein